MELAQFNNLVQQFISTVPGLQLSGCATVDTLGRPRVFSASIAVVGQSTWPTPAPDHLVAATALALQIQIEGFVPICCSCITAIPGGNEILRWQVQFEQNLRAQADIQKQKLFTERHPDLRSGGKSSTKWPVKALVGEHGWVEVHSWNTNGITTDCGSFFTRALVQGIRIYGNRDTYYAKGLDQASRYLLSVRYTISAIRSMGVRVISRLRKKAKTFVYGGSFVSAGFRAEKPPMPTYVRSFIDRVGNLAHDFRKNWTRTILKENLPPEKLLPSKNRDRTLEKADVDYYPSDDEEAQELVRKHWYFYKYEYEDVASAHAAIRAMEADPPFRIKKNFGRSEHTLGRDTMIAMERPDEGRLDESDCEYDSSGAEEDIFFDLPAPSEKTTTDFEQRVWELKAKHLMRKEEMRLQIEKHELALKKSEAELAREELIRKRLSAPVRWH